MPQEMERPTKRPRCCSPIPNEFSPSYASVVMVDSGEEALCDAVKEVETSKLRSSLTAWCSVCKALYLITQTVSLFLSP